MLNRWEWVIKKCDRDRHNYSGLSAIADFDKAIRLDPNYAETYVTRIVTEYMLATEVAAWQARRNPQRKTINWTFTRQNADKKLKKYYVA